MEFYHLYLHDEEKSQHVRVLNRHIRDHSDPLQMPDTNFLKLYRLSKQSVEFLLSRLKPHLKPGVRNGVHPLIKILAALNFYGHGGYQVTVSHDATLGLSQPSISRYLKEVSEGLINTLMKEFIKFPKTHQEKESTKAGFQAMYGMPGVLGAIDCTHIVIVSPPKKHPTHPGIRFYNPKGFYSVNCQMVCDSKLVISNVYANHPGSTHDAEIFDLSRLNKLLGNSYVQGSEEWLLGDSGYTQLPWVMTPLANPQDTPENRYNHSHKQTRAVIERCFAVMKGRFQCLLQHRVLHYSPEMAQKIIHAVAILHNISIHRHDPMPEEQNEDTTEIYFGNDDGHIYDENNKFFDVAMTRRSNLIKRYFT